MNTKPWQQTISGRALVFEDLLDQSDLSQVHITDLAWSCSLENRYSGHTRFPYSVGQHQLIASYAAPLTGANPLECLCHDLHEGITKDMPSPIKQLLGPVWREFEDGIQRAVYAACAPTLTLPMSSECKLIDLAMLAWESGDFALQRINDWNLSPGIIALGEHIQDIAEEHGLARPLHHIDVYNRYLARYTELITSATPKIS